MKRVIFNCILFLLVSGVYGIEKNFFDFVVKDINGIEFKMSSLRGKKVLVVNVASKCGRTKQYEDLQKLYDKYKGRGFVVIGFPANNFKDQEPGTNEEIKKFCELKYGVTFPMMSKISVKGDDTAEIYEWLTKKKYNGIADSVILWNFQKYMINRDGSLRGHVSHKELPFDKKIVDWIEKE